MIMYSDSEMNMHTFYELGFLFDWQQAERIYPIRDHICAFYKLANGLAPDEQLSYQLVTGLVTVRAAGTIGGKAAGAMLLVRRLVGGVKAGFDPRHRYGLDVEKRGAVSR